MSCIFKDEDFATLNTPRIVSIHMAGLGSASREQVTGQEETASNCAREGLGWILGKFLHERGFPA